MVRFVSWFALCGILVPLFFQVVWWLVDRYLTFNISLELGIQNVMMVLWPSSIFLLPAGSDERYFLVGITVAVILNIIFYTSIGVATWYSIKKSYLILVPVGIAIFALSWRMLTL